jgi:hypothetical protein
VRSFLQNFYLTQISEKSKKMWKKFFASFGLGLLVTAMLLVGGRLGSAEPLTYAQEAALFSLDDLGQVDMSPKRVVVEIHASPTPELNSFHRLLPQAWVGVRNFYARMGVLVDMVPGDQEPGNLEVGKRLRFEALTHKEWLAATFKAFQVAPPFRLRFLAVCQDKYAFAHLNLSTIHLDYRRFRDDICGAEPKEAKYSPERLANLIIHELGHLFGLYHAHEFTNDPVAEFLSDGKTPNFMSHYLVKPGGMGFVDFQKRLVHSYLSRGKVFQQYQQVDFDPLRYLELLKLHNRYQEPLSEKTRESQ